MQEGTGNLPTTILLRVNSANHLTTVSHAAITEQCFAKALPASLLNTKVYSETCCHLLTMGVWWRERVFESDTGKERAYLRFPWICCVCVCMLQYLSVKIRVIHRNPLFSHSADFPPIWFSVMLYL